MAREVDKQPPVVQFASMRGRHDEEEDEKILASAHAELIHAEELDLSVVDWKPHKPKAMAAPAWSDPQKLPRFEEIKKLNSDNNMGTPLSPNVDVIKPRTEFLVDMSRQSGRYDREKEEELVWELDGMDAVDQGMAIEVEDEMEEGRKRSEKVNSKQKKVPLLVVMDKQLDRKGIIEKTVAHDIAPYDVDISAVRERTDKGFHDWSKGADIKRFPEDEAHELKSEGLYDNKEELALSPNHMVQSKYVFFFLFLNLYEHFILLILFIPIYA